MNCVNSDCDMTQILINGYGLIVCPWQHKRRTAQEMLTIQNIRIEICLQ